VHIAKSKFLYEYKVLLLKNLDVLVYFQCGVGTGFFSKYRIWWEKRQHLFCCL